MECVYVFLSTFAAWEITGLLDRMDTKAAAAGGAIAGTVCTLLSALLLWGNVSMDLTAPVLFLLGFILLAGQSYCALHRIFSGLVSVGAWALLYYWAGVLRKFLPTVWALALYILLMFLFLVCSKGLRNHFPKVNWEQQILSGSKEGNRARCVWGVLIFMAAAELSLLYIVGLPHTVWKAGVLAAVSAALFWGAVCGVFLMAAYRQERLNTLIDRDYRNEMQVFMNVIRSQRHDYNFHVQALAGLINDGNIDECRRYVNDLVRDSADMNTILPIKDPAISALIFSFRNMAREDGITLHLDIQNDLSCVVTNTYETNKVIGNLLQNAIDEVRTHPDKSFGIHLSILKRGENCVIHVANQLLTKTDPRIYLQNLYAPGRSTKEGHEGIGLCSIRNLLSQYRGVVYARLEDDVIHIVAKIPLHLQGDE